MRLHKPTRCSTGRWVLGLVTWNTRAERPGDTAVVRHINVAAFPGHQEADLVEALRADPEAWIDGLSIVAVDADDVPVAHALLSRCHVGQQPALALAPCAVRPEYQYQGAGSAAIRAGLKAAKEHGENLVVVLGHANYYPRFGFSPASENGVAAPFDVPEDSFLALKLDPTREAPRGEIQYPVAFGV